MNKDIEEFKRLRGELETIYNIGEPLIKTKTYDTNTWPNKYIYFLLSQKFELKCRVFNEIVPKVEDAFKSLTKIKIDELMKLMNYDKLSEEEINDNELLSIINEHEELLPEAKKNLKYLVYQLKFFIDNRRLPETKLQHNIDEPLTEVEQILFINSIEDLRNLSSKVLESLDQFKCIEKEVNDKIIKKKHQKA